MGHDGGILEEADKANLGMTLTVPPYSLMMFFLGVLRGADLQGFGALSMFAAFYFCGLPLSAYLGMQGGLGLAGVWYGNVIGMTLSAVAMGLRLSQIDWQSVALKSGGNREPLLVSTPRSPVGPTLLKRADKCDNVRKGHM